MDNKKGYSVTPTVFGMGQSICLGSGACCYNFEVAGVPGYPTLQEKDEAEKNLASFPETESCTQGQLEEKEKLIKIALGVPALQKPAAQMTEAEIVILSKGYKRMGPCCWLVQASKDDKGQWSPAKCLLHSMPSVYPEECKQFGLPSTPWGGPCSMGMAVWKHRLEEGGKLPGEIQGFFENQP